VEEFRASQSIAGVSMRLKPGGIRELHWHAIAAEWALVLAGTVRTTVISPPTLEEISTSKWLAGNPASLISDNFLITKEEVARLPRKTLGIIK